MRRLRIGIHGFGAAGRHALRAIETRYSDTLEVVRIGGVRQLEASAHLLRHDSAYGPFDGTVETIGESLVVNGRAIDCSHDREPARNAWAESGVDVVLECTEFWSRREQVLMHIEQGGAKLVIIAAPSFNADATLVLGINESYYDPQRHHLISAASTTMCCLAPLAKAIHEQWGIEWALVTNVHAYSSDQVMNDGIHHEARRGRAGAVNIIPTDTGVARAIGVVLPELRGKMHGISFRVPAPTVSCVDVVVQTSQPCGDAVDINKALRAAAHEPYFGYTDEELVSSDFIGDPRSCILDTNLTTVLDERAVRVLAWHDNDTSFSCRLAELCVYIGDRW